MPNRGNKIEQAIVKFLGIRSHLNSGAMKEKMDASSREMVMEIKSTQAKSYKTNRDLLQKIYYSATRRGKIPVLLIAWDDGDNYINIEDMSVVVPAKDFFQLLNNEATTHIYPEEGRINV